MIDLTRRQLLVSGLALACLPGELSSSWTRAAGAQGAGKVRLGGVWVSGNVPAYVGVRKGYFQERGVEVELVRTEGAQSIPGLAAAKLDVVFVNTTSILAAKAQGFDLVVVAPAQEAQAKGPEPASLWVKADSEITTAKDLVGKTLAVNQLRGINWLYAREWLEQQGVAPDSVRFTELNFPFMADAVVNGQVAAAYGTEPWQSSLLEKRLIRILASPFAELQPGVPIALYVALRGWADDNAKAVEGFAAGLHQAVRFTNANSAEARTLWAERDKRPAGSTQNTPLFPFSTRVDKAHVERLMKLMVKHKLLAEPLNVDNLVLPVAQNPPGAR